MAMAMVPNGCGSGSIWMTHTTTPSTSNKTNNHIKSVIMP
jgi:hypothetical protein